MKILICRKEHRAKIRSYYKNVDQTKNKQTYKQNAEEKKQPTQHLPLPFLDNVGNPEY